MNEPRQNLETHLDIQLLYNKGRKSFAMDQQHNKNMINLLKRAQILLDNLRRIPVKNGQVYSHYHRLFKNIRGKVHAELNAAEEQNGQLGQSFRKILSQVVEELGSKARRYEEGERRIKEIGRMRVESQQESEEQEERVKEEMLELMQLFKNHAKDMGKELQRDTSVISDISRKQDNVLNSLHRETNSMKDIAKNSSLGIFALLGYSSIAVMLWLFALVFIMIF